MKYLPTVSHMVWILLLTGCSINDSNSYPEWDKSNLPPENVLQMSLDVPQSTASGKPTLLRMKIKNVSGTNLSLGVLHNPHSVSDNNTGLYDFMITDNKGNLYWSNFYNEPIPDLPASVSLKAGETIVQELEWNGNDIHDQNINPGRYQIVGYYAIELIADKTDGNDQRNEVGFYTTQPQEMIIQ